MVNGMQYYSVVSKSLTGAENPNQPHGIFN